MKAIAALALAAAAVIVLASHEAGAMAPMQSPVATRSRWRDLPATPTPDYSAAQHGTIRDARYAVLLPLVSATTR